MASIPQQLPLDELHSVQLANRACLRSLSSARLPAGTLQPSRASTMLLCATAAILPAAPADTSAAADGAAASTDSADSASGAGGAAIAAICGKGDA